MSVGGDVCECLWEEMSVSVCGRRCLCVSVGGDVCECLWEEMSVSLCEKCVPVCHLIIMLQYLNSANAILF